MSIETKAAFRKRIKAWLQSLSPQVRQQASQKIADYLIEHPLWKKSQAILLYESLPYEVSTDLLLENAWKNEKIVVLPRIFNETLTLHKVDAKEHLIPGPYNFLEPDPLKCSEIFLSEIDLIITPGIAFDATGTRLGRGGGFYDRLLSVSDRRAFTIGIFFVGQQVSILPKETHDIPLDFIITENGLITLK